MHFNSKNPNIVKSILTSPISFSVIPHLNSGGMQVPYPSQRVLARHSCSRLGLLYHRYTFRVPERPRQPLHTGKLWDPAVIGGGASYGNQCVAKGNEPRIGENLPRMRKTNPKGKDKAPGGAIMDNVF